MVGRVGLGQPKPTIIPVAGGKGGVGKSFLTANLAVALAEMGHRVIAVDLDLGGSNLHSFLGKSNNNPGVGDFLKARSAELMDMVVDTDVPNLSFIPGDGRTPMMANINYAQKLRLISRILKLPAEYVMLDLASGSAFNTLDFFRLTPRGLLIATPEHTSIMNMMTFMKNVLVRLFERSFRGNAKIGELLHEAGKRPIGDTPFSVAELQRKVASIDEASGEKLNELCRDYRPRVLFNLGEHPDEMAIADQIDRNLREILSLQVDYFGFVFRDSSVGNSVRKGEAPFLHHSDGVAAANIRRVAERIEKFWGLSPQGTAALIQKHAWDDFGVDEVP